ncbi:phospholipase-like protein [Tanacetum coccineum]
MDRYVRHGCADHRAFHLDKKKQNPDYYPTYNLYGFPLAFKIWIFGELIPNSIKWWSKKDNVLPRALAWSNVTKFGKNDYNGLLGPDSNPNLELYATPVEQQTEWFKASIEYINGLVDLDMNVSEDDIGGDVSNNYFDLNDNVVSGNGNNDVLLLEGGDGFVDSVGGDKNHECNQDKQDKQDQQDQQDKQPSLADVLDELRALRKEVALLKVDDTRIAKLERILNDNFIPCNDRSKGNHNAVNPGLTTSANHPLSTCSRHVVDNPKVACAGTGIHNPARNNDSRNSNHNAVNTGLSCSANDHMSNTSCPEMHNVEVLAAGMGIDKADENIYQPNANDNDVNQGITVSCNAHMENEFADDFMDVLNDEESLPKVSLDDMNVDEQEEKLIDTVKAQSNKSAKERKKRLAMALESPFGQQPPTTPVPTKSISRSVNCDFILPPDFEEDVSGQPKMRSINDNGSVCRGRTISKRIREFWLVLACLDKSKQGWLIDSHIDLWVDLMWCIRQPDADWAMLRGEMLRRCIFRLMNQRGTVYEELEYRVLVPNDVNYSNLVRYVKKFKLADGNQICLSYNISSNHINIIDDDDVCYFVNEVSGQEVKKVYIKLGESTIQVTQSSYTKPVDIDLNVPVFQNPYFIHQWKEKNPLMFVPFPPHAPTLVSESKHRVKFTKHYTFDDKEACIYEIAIKCLREGYQCKVLKSSTERSLIIIDAAHLKGTYLGTNLVAVGMDGNNQIIPIATGVSQGETGESWTWFLKRLKECIDVSTWEIPNEIQQVLPPDMGKKQSGRPKNRDRIRSQGEGPIIKMWTVWSVKDTTETSS